MQYHFIVIFLLRAHTHTERQTDSTLNLLYFLASLLTHPFSLSLFLSVNVLFNISIVVSCSHIPVSQPASQSVFVNIFIQDLIRLIIYALAMHRQRVLINTQLKIEEWRGGERGERGGCENEMCVRVFLLCWNRICLNDKQSNRFVVWLTDMSEFEDAVRVCVPACVRVRCLS